MGRMELQKELYTICYLNMYRKEHNSRDGLLKYNDKNFEIVQKKYIEIIGVMKMM